jgi:hypothetical protein
MDSLDRGPIASKTDLRSLAASSSNDGILDAAIAEALQPEAQRMDVDSPSGAAESPVDHMDLDQPDVQKDTSKDVIEIDDDGIVERR